jgi:hypothetical protein
MQEYNRRLSRKIRSDYANQATCAASKVDAGWLSSLQALFPVISIEMINIEKEKDGGLSGHRVRVLFVIVSFSLAH